MAACSKLCATLSISHITKNESKKSLSERLTIARDESNPLRNIETDKTKLKVCKNINKKLKKELFLLGRGRVCLNIPEAVNDLISQHYPELLQYNGGEILQIIIPEFFLHNAAQAVDHERFEEVEAKTDGSRLSSLQGQTIRWKGIAVEKDFHSAIKAYFQNKTETVLVIQGILIKKLGLEGGGKEKDFIVVNHSKGYILMIEVKKSLLNEDTMEISAKQVQDVQEVLEDWFDSEISPSWRIIPIICCWNLQKEILCQKCQRFVIEGSENFSSQLDSLISNLDQNYDPGETIEEFKTIAKHLIFTMSLKELPIRSKLKARVKKCWKEIGSYENISLWCFLSPEQKILKASNEPYVMIVAPFSCGKTTMLTLEANTRKENGLFVNCTKTDTRTLQSLCLEASLDIPVISCPQGYLRNIRRLKKDYPNVEHLFIDEFVPLTFKMTNEELESLQFILKDLKANFKTVWVVLARAYVVRDEDKDYEDLHEMIKSWFPDFAIPQLRYPLRSTGQIATEVKLCSKIRLENGNQDLITKLISNMKIPANITEGPRVWVSPKFENMMTFWRNIEEALDQMGQEKIMIIKDNLVTSILEEELDHFVHEKRSRRCLHFHEERKESEIVIKKWISGDLDQDLITDSFHAMGFEFDCVIVIGDPEVSMQAMSRAIYQLAVVQAPLKKEIR